MYPGQDIIAIYPEMAKTIEFCWVLYDSLATTATNVRVSIGFGKNVIFILLFSTNDDDDGRFIEFILLHIWTFRLFVFVNYAICKYFSWFTEK